MMSLLLLILHTSNCVITLSTKIASLSGLPAYWGPSSCLGSVEWEETWVPCIRGKNGGRRKVTDSSYEVRVYSVAGTASTGNDIVIVNCKI